MEECYVIKEKKKQATKPNEKKRAKEKEKKQNQWKNNLCIS